jgi:hypothetical protein
VVTAYVERASTIKASGILRKPIDVDMLLAVVKRHCGDP